MNLTGLEKRCLRNIAENLLNAGNGAVPTNADETATWLDCVADQGPHIMDPKQVRALTTTLQAKGMAVTQGRGRDACIQLTQKGFEEYLQLLVYGS